MTRTIEFYFDVGSPASYLASTQLPRIAADAGATLAWRPMLLGGVFQATGNTSPASIPAKGRFMQDDLRRFAERYGVPYAHNPFFPINTLMLMRGATGFAMHEPTRLADYVAAVYRAIWVDGLDMNDAGVVADALGRAGFDAAAVMARASDPAVKAELKRTTDEAVARGVFGAPSMFVDDVLYFGQDRLDFVREALAA